MTCCTKNSTSFVPCMCGLTGAVSGLFRSLSWQRWWWLVRGGSIRQAKWRAGHGWRESLYRHQGCFKASDCGRLGRQAAGHPWSALRVVKSCRKDCPTAEVLLGAKAAAPHPKRYQSSLSKLSKRRWVRWGKEAQTIGLASQSDGQKSDGQTGRNKADERWYPSRPCSVLNSGL